MKNNWLTREIHCSALSYTLCTTEAQFHAEIKRFALPRPDWPPFLSNSHSNATTHFFDQNGTGQHCAIVCLPPPEAKQKRTGVQIACLIVHEAVHIWQNHCEMIGEKAPSSEFEAYGVQSIAQALMTEYARQVFPERN